MPLANQRKTTSEQFADLLQRAQQSDTFQIDRLKVEISERIYAAMKQQGTSNAELARRLGKSRAYVTKLLRGTTNFTLESLVRIGWALSCEVEFELLPKARRAKAPQLPSSKRSTPQRLRPTVRERAAAKPHAALVRKSTRNNKSHSL